MRITVIGAGYVGLVSAACLAEVGNQVVCLDLDSHRIDCLRGGGVPIHEKGLPELIRRNTEQGRLDFTTDTPRAVQHGDVIFIAVGTPPDPVTGDADLRYVLAAGRDIARHMQADKIVVEKSTVPVGTAQKLMATIDEELRARPGEAGAPSLHVNLVSNPEFLKEGAAIEDFMRPDRVVIGTESGAAGERARVTMRALYAPFNRHSDRILCMDIQSAEFTKYAANAMLATRISFINELANLADTLGVDIENVRKGIGSDQRIGYSFLYAGLGYGGSCFPKDVKALLQTAAGRGQRLRILEAVSAVNDAQKHVLVDKILKRFNNDLSGLTFAVWGLAFKPETDDMREAPSRVIVKELLARGARVLVHDPVAMEEARRCFESDLKDVPNWQLSVGFEPVAMRAVEGADALIVLTDWKEYKSPDFEQLKRALKQPLIFDGRNLFEPTIRTRGFEYCAIGR
jgi:UDPglucose 6-dehydrogenase